MMPRQKSRTVHRGRNKRTAPPCIVCGAACGTDASGSYRGTCMSDACLYEVRSRAARKASHPDKLDSGLGNPDLRYRRRTKLLVLQFYSNGTMRCACCGISYIEFLTIDHIDGGGADHRRSIGKGNLSGGNFYKWLIQQKYPPGYRVLCQNCNFSRGVFGYCPHEKMTDLLLSPIDIFNANVGANKRRKVTEVPCDSAGADQPGQFPHRVQSR